MFSILCCKLHSDILFSKFSCIKFTPFLFLSLISKSQFNHYLSSRLIFQAHTVHLHQIYHQCSHVIYISQFISLLLQDNHINCMLDNSIYLLLSFKYYLGCRLLTAVFSRPDFRVLCTKVSQDLVFIWSMSRAMD